MEPDTSFWLDISGMGLHCRFWRGGGARWAWWSGSADVRVEARADGSKSVPESSDVFGIKQKQPAPTREAKSQLTAPTSNPQPPSALNQSLLLTAYPSRAPKINQTTRRFESLGTLVLGALIVSKSDEGAAISILLH